MKKIHHRVTEHTENTDIRGHSIGAPGILPRSGANLSLNLIITSVFSVLSVTL